MEPLTFAQMDQLAAERAAKKRELVERFSTLLARESLSKNSASSNMAKAS
jgi:hypothetical protein